MQHPETAHFLIVPYVTFGEGTLTENDVEAHDKYPGADEEQCRQKNFHFGAICIIALTGPSSVS